MNNASLFKSISTATLGVLCMLQAQPAASQERRGVIPHAPLLKMVVPDTANQEVAVYEAEYAPGGSTPDTYIPQRLPSMSCRRRCAQVSARRTFADIVAIWTSQMRAAVSFEAVTMRVPSGLKAAEFT